MRDWLRKEREAKGLTQVCLAGAVGVDATTIGKYELGLRQPSVGAAKKIADALILQL